MKALFLLAALAAISLRADPVLLSDDFSSPTLDPSKWVTVLPHYDSLLTDNNGSVTTTNGGILATKASFTGPYTVNGSFTLLDDYEHFQIALRSDLTPTDSTNQCAGIIVTFVNDGQGISIQQYPDQMADENDWTQPATTGGNGFSLVTGDTYFFSISDTGSAIGVSIDGTDVLDAPTDFATGGQVGFYSREFGNGTEIGGINIVDDSIVAPSFSADFSANVTAPASVPDIASTAMLLLLGCGLMIGMRALCSS